MTSLVASAAVAVRAHADASSTATSWTKVWSDDFTGAAGTGVNTTNWRYDLGTGYPGGATQWGTNEVETMTKSTSNVYQDGSGHLVIKPTRDSSGKWTSGRIETERTDFAAPAGGKIRVEASIRQPDVSGAAAAGYWPAFWMLGAPARAAGATNWPEVGEIDIMEDVNGLSSLFGTLHCGVASGGPCNETTGLGSGQRACQGCQTGYHTYAAEYDRSVSPEQIRWYVDGTNYFTLSADKVGSARYPTAWEQATHHGFFLILNLAMGGGFPAAFGAATPTSATQPGVPMSVDYVAVYTSNGSSPSPSTSTSDGTNASSIIQAEASNAQMGTQAESTADLEGGQDVGWIANGDWLRFDRVNFGTTPLTQVKARVASGAPAGVSGLVEVRLDSISNDPVGTFEIGNTGGWQTWRTVPANIAGITGAHTVYLRFASGQPADFVNVNWLTFSP